MRALTKWNPSREMDVFSDRFNRVFHLFGMPDVWRDGPTVNGHWNPAVDVYDEKEHFVLKAELPGIDKKNISIDFSDDTLTIKGKRVEDNEETKERFYRRERCMGTFQRSFQLPAGVTVEDIKADYKGGILKVEIPKPEENKPKRITVH